MADAIQKEHIVTGQNEVPTKQADQSMKIQGLKTRTLGDGGVKLMNCAGMDVHKKVLVVAACITNPMTLVPTFQVYRTTVHAEDVRKAACWLKSMGIVDVAMESSGKYWYGPFKTLEEESLRPVLTHPKYVKAPKGTKNDVNDAMHIANCFRMGMVIPSFIPPADIRDMRELCRYRMKLVATCTQEKNRYQNGLAACNIRLDNVFSDVFGATCQKIMDIALNSGLGSITEETLQGLLGKNCKATPKDVMNAIDGGEFVGSQQLKLQLHKEHIDSIVSIISKIDEKLKVYADKYRKQIDHIMSMVAVKETAAIYILAEIGTDMAVWKNKDSFANWAGLVPASNSSAGKHKSTHIGNGGYYLKPILVQCALAASRSKAEPYFSYKYENFKKRRGHKKAIIAIAHKMACSIYAMLSKDEDFRPSDLYTYQKRQWKANRKPKLPWSYSDLEELMKKNNVSDEAIKSVIDVIRESARALPEDRSAQEAANVQELDVSVEMKGARENDGNESVHDGSADGRPCAVCDGNRIEGNNENVAGKMPGRARSVSLPDSLVKDTDARSTPKKAPRASGRSKKVTSNSIPSTAGKSQGENAAPSPKNTGKRPGRPKKTAPVTEPTDHTQAS